MMYPSNFLQITKQLPKTFGQNALIMIVHHIIMMSLELQLIGFHLNKSQRLQRLTFTNEIIFNRLQTRV